MKKTVNAGEEFTIGRWSIVFSGSPKTIAGDINCDGVADESDIVSLRKQLIVLEYNENYNYDVNADGGINIADLVYIQLQLISD